MEKKSFWKLWFKFVGILIIIFILWLGLIFICDHIFGDKFEKFKFIHYFILLAIIIKVKKHFLKTLDSNK